MHRFALNGTSKAIGGMEYSNAVRGDAQQATRPVSYAQQTAALKAMLDALRPEELAIPDTVLTLMAPGRQRGHAERRALRQPNAAGVRRARRGADAGANDRGHDSPARSRRPPGGVRDARRRPTSHARPERSTISSAATWTAATPATPKLAAIQRVTQRVVANKLLLLAADSEATPEVRAMAELKLADLRARARSRLRRRQERRGARALVVDRERLHALDRQTRAAQALAVARRSAGGSVRDRPRAERDARHGTRDPVRVPCP